MERGCGGIVLDSLDFFLGEDAHVLGRQVYGFPATPAYAGVRLILVAVLVFELVSAVAGIEVNFLGDAVRAYTIVGSLGDGYLQGLPCGVLGFHEQLAVFIVHAEIAADLYHELVPDMAHGLGKDGGGHDVVDSLVVFHDCVFI